jgi:hypothetical protein
MCRAIFLFDIGFACRDRLFPIVTRLSDSQIFVAILVEEPKHLHPP